MRCSLLVGALALLLPVDALAGQSDLICARPGVLERLAELLHQAGREFVLGPPITELSTGLDREVHCAVSGRMRAHDTSLYGLQPVDVLTTVRYTLELGKNGIFLRLD